MRTYFLHQWLFLATSLFFLLGFSEFAVGTSQELAFQKAKHSSSFKFSSGVTYSQSAVVYDDAKDSQSMNFNLGLSWKHSDRLKLNVRLDAYQDLKQKSERYADIHALDLSASFPKIISHPWVELSFTPYVAAALPLSEVLRDYDSLLATFSVGHVLGYNPQGSVISMSYFINYSRNIHEYQESLRGFDNKQHVVTNSLSFSFLLYKEVSFVASFGWSGRWTYETEYDSIFSMNQLVKFNLAKNISMQFGHMNRGLTLHADGRTHQVRLFNENSSGVFVGVSVWI